MSPKFGDNKFTSKLASSKPKQEAADLPEDPIIGKRGPGYMDDELRMGN